MMVFPLDEVHLNPTTVRVIRRPKKKNAPELNGSPKLLVNKRSTQSAMDTVFGIMKFCIPTKITRDRIPAKMKDFQVNEYFLKYTLYLFYHYALHLHPFLEMKGNEINYK